MRATGQSAPVATTFGPPFPPIHHESCRARALTDHAIQSAGSDGSRDHRRAVIHEEIVSQRLDRPNATHPIDDSSAADRPSGNVTVGNTDDSLASERR